MKGIILAGGKGTRLYPITSGLSKQLLPIYDKPMIYYPLSILMFAGITEILIITTPDQKTNFQNVLGNGEKWGLVFKYITQSEPRGLADAFILGSDFINGEKVTLTLGDNIFFGSGLISLVQSAAQLETGAVIFAYPVKNPKDFGIIELNNEGKPISLEEKPLVPKSNYAIPGIYFYDEKVCEYAAGLAPSERGELEITDLNRIYLLENQLDVKILGRGIAWLDAGTHESLLQASNFVQTIEERQGLMISCPEEIAYRMGLINQDQLLQLANGFNNQYGEYLLSIL